MVHQRVVDVRNEYLGGVNISGLRTTALERPATRATLSFALSSGDERYLESLTARTPFLESIARLPRHAQYVNNIRNNRMCQGAFFLSLLHAFISSAV